MYPDFKEFLSALNEHRVKYLVVGAYALSIHAQPRATKDLDIWVEPDPENAKAVFRALAKFGAPLAGITSEDFASEGQFFRMGNPPLGVDILTKVDGLQFDGAWQHRITDVVDDATGLKASFLSRDDFIASKLAAGRPQDMADVDAVRKAQQSQGSPLAKRKPPPSVPESDPTQ